MVVKYQRNKKRVSLLYEKEENYISDTENEIDANQANNEYILPN